MLNYIFSRKWLLGHLVVAILFVVCLRLGLWQWDRARITHSPQNYGYALQWPFFAIFGVYMWVRMIRIEYMAKVDPDGEQAEYLRKNNARSYQLPDNWRDNPANQFDEIDETAVAANPDDEDPEMAAYNAMLAQLHLGQEEARPARKISHQ